MRKTAIILAGLITVFCMGCSQKSDVRIIKQNEKSTISFSWWGDDTRHDYTLDSVNAFQKKNQGIIVETRYGEWEGFENRMRIMIASDTCADVMQLDYNWLRKYSPDGNEFYDLDRLKSYLSLGHFTEQELEFGMVEGRLNALPVAIDTAVFYWNKTLFEKYGLDLPKDWDDLFEAAEVMRRDGVYPICAMPQLVWCMAQAYAEQKTGKKLINDDGTLGFDVHDMECMTAFCAELIEKKALAQIDIYEQNYLADEKYAGALAWISDADTYCLDAREAGNEIAVGDFLIFGEAKNSGWYIKPMMMYAISANTDYPRESALLMNYMLNDEEAILNQGLEKGMPVTQASRELLKENGMLEGLRYEGCLKMDSAMNSMGIMSPYIEDKDMAEAFCAAAAAVAAKNADAETVAVNLYDKMKQIVGEA